MQSPIRAILLLVFIAIPLMEIALLIKIGQVIGFWATILIVVGTAVIGTWLLHAQGLQTLHKVMDATGRGVPPVEPVLEGFVLLVAGLLLLTPGILTDTIGFVLLIPPIRTLLVRHALSKLFIVTVSAGKRPPGRGTEDQREAWTSPRHGPDQSRGRKETTIDDGVIIEGEFERIDEPETSPKNRKPS